MTDPINTLMNEHAVILGVLEALGNYAQELEQNSSAERAELVRFADFFQLYADKFHHGKEEDILFAEMAKHGFSAEAGPVAVMLTEHDQGRRLVRALRAAGEKAGQPWTPEEIKEVVGNAGQFIVLLGSHIHKEDNILYPMAQTHIPYTLMQNMGTTFEKFAEEKKAEGTEERMLALAEDLAVRYTTA